MALTAPELEAMRDELLKARARGLRSVQNNGERVEYKTDAEMMAAISDLEARILRASSPRPGAVLFSSSKGL
jgi:hypothetical protein